MKWFKNIRLGFKKETVLVPGLCSKTLYLITQRFFHQTVFIKCIRISWNLIFSKFHLYFLARELVRVRIYGIICSWDRGNKSVFAIDIYSLSKTTGKPIILSRRVLILIIMHPTVENLVLKMRSYNMATHQSIQGSGWHRGHHIITWRMIMRPGHHVLPDLLGAFSSGLQDVPVGSLIISV